MAEPEKLIPRHGGYRRLKSFQIAQLIYEVTARFCDRYIDRHRLVRESPWESVCVRDAGDAPIPPKAEGSDLIHAGIIGNLESLACSDVASLPLLFSGQPALSLSVIFEYSPSPIEGLPS